MEVKIDDLKNIRKEKAVVDFLLDNHMKITFAESCTGGLISKRITDVAGASGCFECGFVTYSNRMKERLLGVSAETLKKHGAVSYETAYEMCKGARLNADADVAVSVTGIAGPGGGTEKKPVGLVYVGVCTESVHTVCKLMLKGNRESVREQTVDCAMDMVYRALNGDLKSIDGNSMVADIEYV